MFDIDSIPEFRSGNGVPVTRATISRERMQEAMEAYAEARVRAALEEAANVALDAPITAGMEANEGALALSIHANSRIRALIHTTK